MVTRTRHNATFIRKLPDLFTTVITLEMSTFTIKMHIIAYRLSTPSISLHSFTLYIYIYIYLKVEIYNVIKIVKPHFLCCTYLSPDDGYSFKAETCVFFLMHIYCVDQLQHLLYLKTQRDCATLTEKWYENCFRVSPSAKMRHLAHCVKPQRHHKIVPVVSWKENMNE